MHPGEEEVLESPIIADDVESQGSAPTHQNHCNKCAKDVDYGSFKIMENLHIKIGEAKHLVPGSKETRNTYCGVLLDQEVVSKTHIVEKSLSPFFQEEFDFDIPHHFRFLCFHFHDVQGDVLTKKDHVFAKVAVKKTDISKYNGKEHWFPLTPVEGRGGDVQGQVHVELKFQQLQQLLGSEGSDIHRLNVRVPECTGLLISGGNCDPYVAVSLQGTHRNETKKTKVRKANANPHFDEEFVFEHRNKLVFLFKSWFALCVKVCFLVYFERISVYSSGTLGDEFLGEVRIPLFSVINKASHSGWYLLNPRMGKCNANGSKDDYGSVRVKITYTKDCVFPTQAYDELLNSLLSSMKTLPVCATWPSLIATVCGVRKRPQVAACLVRIFLQQGELTSLIEPVADDEIAQTKDSNMIFRNSSFTACLVEESMRVVGFNYLRNVLSPTMEKIRSERKSCEIDPTRLADGENRSDETRANMVNLWEYVHEVIRSIVNSLPQCPSLLCEIFSGIRNSASHYFPDNPNAPYSGVTNFIFLRFFAAALLCPRKYKLVNEQLDPTTARTFTLVSKVVQHLCNMSMPKPGNTVKSASVVQGFVNKFVNQEHVDSIKNFVDIISSPYKGIESKCRSSSILDKVVLKEGMMVKRAQGRTFLLGRKNFKTRYFALTNYELSYGKRRKSKPLCTIPVQDIRGVEKLQEDSFRMAYMFQVIQPNRVLYCQAGNSVEQKAWMDVLMKVCTCNKNRAQYFHPGAYVQGKHTCCGSTTMKAPGCTKVTGNLPASIRLNIDQDRDLERIYSLISGSVERIHKLQAEECGARTVYMGPQLARATKASFDVRDPQYMFRALCAILDCVQKLDHVHEQYAQSESEFKIGTQERPYGD
uniref:Ras GTPase-activating protein n=1 Tax=Ciona intestinalis TaxID=7719 RepID=F6ZQ65_CIOIN